MDGIARESVCILSTKASLQENLPSIDILLSFFATLQFGNHVLGLTWRMHVHLIYYSAKTMELSCSCYISSGVVGDLLFGWAVVTATMESHCYHSDVIRAMGHYWT